MRKTQSLTSIFGMTQDDIALILKVDRSRFAKYEAGSRNLPLPSTLLLAEMAQCVYDTDAAGKTALHEATQEAQKREVVHKLLKENEYQQLATARKITRVEAKYTAKLRALKLLEFLTVKKDDSYAIEPAVLHSIQRKTLQSLKSNGLDTLFRLKLKLELLQLEKLLLDAEVRKIELSALNSGGKE